MANIRESQNSQCCTSSYFQVAFYFALPSSMLQLHNKWSCTSRILASNRKVTASIPGNGRYCTYTGKRKLVRYIGKHVLGLVTCGGKTTVTPTSRFFFTRWVTGSESRSELKWEALHVTIDQVKMELTESKAEYRSHLRLHRVESTRKVITTFYSSQKSAFRSKLPQK